jgi:hypothetical protein
MAQFEIPERTTAESSRVTIGEALEVAAMTAGDKPVDIADAAAVQAAEMRATGLSGVVPGGVGSAAQKAVATNARAEKEEEKTRLAEVVGNAAAVLPANKAATWEDAQRVREAEEGNLEKGEEREEDGLAAALTEAARINEERGP